MRRMAMLSCVMLCATAVGGRPPMDARFIVNGERQVRGWTFNAVEAFNPYGDVKGVMLNGRAGVRLTSKGKQTQIYQDVALDVKPGERYRVSAKVRGRGAFSLGFFKTGTKHEWRGGTDSSASRLAAPDAEPEAVSNEYVVEADVARLRAHLCVRDGAEVEFYDVVVEKL